MGGDWHRAWEAALDGLELDLAAAESLLAEDHLTRDHPLTDQWHPPAGLGPLPLDLRPRADAILARQIAAVTSIGRALVINRRETGLLDRLAEQHRPAPRPAYVDCAM